MTLSADQLGPSSVVLSALARYERSDWSGLAAFADPTSLAAWRDEYLEAHLRPPNLDTVRRQHPNAPAEAVRRLLETELIPARRRFLDRLQDHIAGVTTAEQVERLPPSELLARYWEARDPHEQIRRMYAAAAQPLPPEFVGRVSVGQFAIVREERVGSGVVAVTWREREADGDGTRWQLRQQPHDDWRILVDLDFLCVSHDTVAYLIDDPNLMEYFQRIAKERS